MALIFYAGSFPLQHSFALVLLFMLYNFKKQNSIHTNYWFFRSVSDVFSRLAEKYYNSFCGTLKCGNFDCAVQLFPHPDPYIRSDRVTFIAIWWIWCSFWLLHVDMGVEDLVGFCFCPRKDIGYDEEIWSADTWIWKVFGLVYIMMAAPLPASILMLGNWCRRHIRWL